MDDNEMLWNHCSENGNGSKSCGFKFTASLGHGCLFFAHALKYNVSSVVLSKLGNIDGAYYSKVTLPFGLELRAERLLPNFERTWQGTLLEGHNKKKTPMPFLTLLSRYGKWKRSYLLISRYGDTGGFIDAFS